MEGKVIKTFNTVVMDGSDVELVTNIIGYFYRFNEGRIKKLVCRPLGEEYPTMMVIQVDTDEDTYIAVQELIEDHYPGLCMCNPPMIID